MNLSKYTKLELIIAFFLNNLSTFKATGDIFLKDPKFYNISLGVKHILFICTG